MPGKITLDITDGPMTGKSFVFTEHDTFIFGRDPECHARLAENDTTASRQHFMLEVNPPDVRVRDLGSLNGTFVNDKAIGKREANETPEQGRARNFPEVDLKSGDALKVGASIFKLTIETPAYCNDCNKEIALQERDALRAPSGVYVCRECRARAAMMKTELPNAPKAIVCKECGKDVAREIGDGRRGDYVCQDCQAKVGDNPVALLIKAIMERQRAQQPAQAPQKADDGIPGYAIEKMLGAGGMGAVYLARRNSDGQRVAIKVMLAKVAVNEHMREVFGREIEITKQLRHPNVITLFEHGSAGPGFYFVMELCAMGSVDDLISARGGRLSLEEGIPLAMSALDGLAYLHDNSFVHRDLKPANLLIAAPGHAKISDMGLAKNFDKAGLSGMTVTGAMAGTVLFMPKEQITNYKFVKPPTDVFSFGATLYNMLTGTTPRDYPVGSDPMQVVLKGPSVPIRQRDGRIPERIAAVIDRACAAAWKDRYANAREMREALAHAL
jgi:serine/threonine-protein kinase